MPLRDSRKAAGAGLVGGPRVRADQFHPAGGPTLIPRGAVWDGPFELHGRWRHSIGGHDLEPRRWVMYEIPLDIQRKFERRWAARFAREVPPAAPRSQPQQQQLSAPAKAKSTPTKKTVLF
jgi:hypothetical protein